MSKKHIIEVLQLTGVTADPAVSNVDTLKIAYRSDIDRPRVSHDGSAFFLLGGFIPQTTSVTGTQNNFSLSGPKTYLRCTGAAPVFNGFAPNGANPVDGDMVIIDCLGTSVQAAYEAGGSTAQWRIITPSALGQIVGAGGRMLFVYDGTTARWRESLMDAGAPLTYTPAWAASGSSPSIGDGTLTGKFLQRGKTCWMELRLVIGSTTSIGTGTYTFSQPLAAVAAGWSTLVGRILDSGTTRFLAAGDVNNTTTFQVVVDANLVAIGATTPMAWAVGDTLNVSGEYETS